MKYQKTNRTGEKNEWRKLVLPKRYIYSLFHVVIYLCLASYYKFKLILLSTDDGR